MTISHNPTDFSFFEWRISFENGEVFLDKCLLWDIWAFSHMSNAHIINTRTVLTSIISSYYSRRKGHINKRKLRGGRGCNTYAWMVLVVVTSQPWLGRGRRGLLKSNTMLYHPCLPSPSPPKPTLSQSHLAIWRRHFTAILIVNFYWGRLALISYTF